jgi:glucose/arabinose dehydrogenase
LIITAAQKWNIILENSLIAIRFTAVIAVCFLSASAGWAQTELKTVFSGLSSPVFVTNAHDGSKRLFVVEQGGRILVSVQGTSQRTVFLDIQDHVVFGGEQGLLGLAFHPQYPANLRFFVDYTRAADGATVISEFHCSEENPNSADPNSEVVLLVIPQPYVNHNGGMVEFGPDGYLYIGMGDGGSGNDPENRAQNIDELLGKILRIDVDHSDGSGAPYSSPDSNPFFGSTPGRDEIYALGMRNPWRFSFDRATGQLYVGDVGQDTTEEVDIITLGGNYGWRVLEGTHCTNLGPASCSDPKFIPPISEYTHVSGRCAIMGGYVYRGTRGAFPLGTYVFGDLCTGEVFTLSIGSQSVLMQTPFVITSFGEDEDGEIYLVDYTGAIYRFDRKFRAQTTSI